MENYIPRIAEKEIRELMSFFPAVAIVGPRQVGKTTLARHLSPDFIYLDLEDERDRAKIEADIFFFLDRYKDKCVILDEIQELPNLFKNLRSIIDSYRKPGRFILLGSASPDLLRQSAESLAGRIAYVELTGLSLQEIKNRYSPEEHWLKGGFPLALLAPTDALSMKWRKQFIKTYTERDLPALGLDMPGRIIQRFWLMLAGENGGIWQAQKFARALGLSAYHIKKMLHFLENSYLISLLPPWFANVSKRLIKSPKVYQRDTGILHALLHIEHLDDLLSTAALGNSWEAYVIEQIKSSAPDEHSFYFYRTHQGAECDLIIVKNNKPVASIEIKFSSTASPGKGFYTAIQDVGSPNNFILTFGDADEQLRDNLYFTGINTFIEKYLPGL